MKKQNFIIGVFGCIISVATLIIIAKYNLYCNYNSSLVQLFLNSCLLLSLSIKQEYTKINIHFFILLLAIFLFYTVIITDIIIEIKYYYNQLDIYTVINYVLRFISSFQIIILLYKACLYKRTKCIECHANNIIKNNFCYNCGKEIKKNKYLSRLILSIIILTVIAKFSVSTENFIWLCLRGRLRTYIFSHILNYVFASIRITFYLLFSLYFYFCFLDKTKCKKSQNNIKQNIFKCILFFIVIISHTIPIIYDVITHNLYNVELESLTWYIQEIVFIILNIPIYYIFIIKKKTLCT